MKLLKVFIFVITLTLARGALLAQSYVRNTTVIDTPTAYTITRGTYQVSVLGYDRGGVEFKTFIGLHDNLFLGISLDVQNAIGKEKTEPNVPGVVAKIKFTDGWERFPISFAVGYDSFYIGQQGRVMNNTTEENQGEFTDNELNRMIYGPYFVVTKPIYLLDDEQHINFGMRVPSQPNYVPGDTSYFLSLDIPMGQYIVLKAEGERVYYDFSRPSEWLFNTGLRFSYLNRLGIEFAFLFQSGEQVHRILRVDFRNEF